MNPNNWLFLSHSLWNTSVWSIFRVSMGLLLISRIDGKLFCAGRPHIFPIFVQKCEFLITEKLRVVKCSYINRS